MPQKCGVYFSCQPPCGLLVGMQAGSPVVLQIQREDELKLIVLDLP